MPDHRLVLDGGLRDDAIEALRAAACWRLSESRWRVVADAVSALSTAARDADVDAFRRAVYDLELVGPVRAVGADETSIVVAPDTVRVEIGRLSDVIESAESGEV